MKILFISSRNIYNSSGEIRLVKTRANVLSEIFNINTDFICYRNKEVLNNPQEIIDKNSQFALFTYSMTNPLSIVINKAKTKKKVVQIVKNYDAIIISGELVLNLVEKIKAVTDVPIIYDIHGVCDELIEYSSDNFAINLKRKFLYYLFQHLEKKYIPKFDAAFAVTEELKKHVSRKYDAGELNYFIVPCSKRKCDIDEETIRKNRIFYRKKYKIADDEILFIYSGGYSPWQCVDESIALFYEFQKRYNKCKFLILSGDEDKIKTNGNINIIKDSVPFDKVDSTICAGDYAFMLREDKVTNNVAFPNKYCEYLASGMKIISSPYLNTISKSIIKHNVGLVLDNNLDIDRLYEYVISTKNEKTDINVRQKMLNEISFDETLKSFVKYLGV